MVHINILKKVVCKGRSRHEPPNIFKKSSKQTNKQKKAKYIELKEKKYCVLDFFTFSACSLTEMKMRGLLLCFTILQRRNCRDQGMEEQGKR